MDTFRTLPGPAACCLAERRPPSAGARYTHRVAIPNHRLVSFEGGRKDYANGGKKREMPLSADEFLRRFLLHFLPRGFVRIRHSGSLANRHRSAVKTILAGLGRSRDFSGCYVLLREGKPFYGGISRGIIGRLRQHSTGTTEFNATLAYRMANEKVPHEKTRREAMQDPAFRAAFDEAQALLRGCSVAFVEVPNPWSCTCLKPTAPWP